MKLKSMEVPKITNMTNLEKINKFLQRLRGILKSSTRWGGWKYLKDGLAVPAILGMISLFVFHLMLVWVSLTTYDEAAIYLIETSSPMYIGFLILLVYRVAVLRKRFKRR